MSGRGRKCANLSTTAPKRLQMDYMRLKKDPIPFIEAEPLPWNVLEWHYVITGPEQTPFSGGLFHGKLLFPAEYPFKPPSIIMLTPNGRFQCQKRLCLSMSDYHPDTWNPAWSVSSILTGLLSFMLEKSPSVGSIETSDQEKRRLAGLSHEFNLNSQIFVQLFPRLASASAKIVQSQNRSRTSSRLRSASGLLRSVDQQNGQGYQSTALNLLIVGGLAVLMLAARYIIQSLTTSSDEA